MAIGADKARIILTVNKEIKEELQKMADKDNRNLSNFLNNLLTNYVREHK